MTPELLLQHLDQGTPWPAGSGLALGEAYERALSVRQLRLRRGEQPRGYKVGFTNRILWPRYGVDAPIWGTIYNTMLTWLAKIIVGAQQLPGQISTAIQTGLNGLSGWWNGFWSGLWSNVSSWWSQIISTVSYYANQVISIVNGALGAISKLSGGLINLHIPKLPTTATGGIFAGAQTRVIGEAGPEAVVPLARDLSRVDPAVRALSAFAQGKLTGQQQTGPQKVITVAEGAVQVQYQGVDPRIVGTSAIDRLVARFATA